MTTIAQRLRELGYRLTPQRLMVATALDNSEGHISADELCSRVRSQYPLFNISTVYRTLELLESLGLVTETDLGEGKVRYHAMGKGHHHHLVCRKCGALRDLEEEELEALKAAIRSKHHFEADLTHLAIFGRCSACSDGS